MSNLKKMIEDKSAFVIGNRLYTAEEYKQIIDAEKQEEYYDLLQLTKKISL